MSTRIAFWCGLAVMASVPGHFESSVSSHSAEGVSRSRADGLRHSPSVVGPERSAPSTTSIAWGSVAGAQTFDAPDSDEDGMPDDVERIFLTNPYSPDSDADGFGDLFEWVQSSDPNDAVSKPALDVAVRMHSYEQDGLLRQFVGMYPANPHLIDAFKFHLASEQFDFGTGDPFPVVDLTSMIPAAISSASTNIDNGLQTLGFTFDLPSSMLDQFAPMTLAVTVKLAQEIRMTEAVLEIVPATGSRNITSLMTGFDISANPKSFVVMPLALGTLGDDPEYCELEVGDGVPFGGAGIRYSVLDAVCAPKGFSVCVHEDCELQIGTVKTEVDRGFLQDEIDD